MHQSSAGRIGILYIKFKCTANDFMIEMHWKSGEKKGIVIGQEFMQIILTEYGYYIKCKC